MTEKRFIYKNKYGTCIIVDAEDNMLIRDMYRACDILNQLSNKNEMLEKSNSQFAKNIDESVVKIRQLVKENEQLKKELKESDTLIEEVWRKYEIAHGLSIDNTDWF